MVHRRENIARQQGVIMQLSENSILFDLSSAFANDMQTRISQMDQGNQKSNDFSNDDFCREYRFYLETYIKGAKALSDLTSFIDFAIDSNAMTWNTQSEGVVSRWFVHWQEASEKLRVRLPECIASRKFNELVASFLRAEEFVQSWLAKQKAYELGVPEIDLPDKLPFGGPAQSWYQESFDRSL